MYVPVTDITNVIATSHGKNAATPTNAPVSPESPFPKQSMAMLEINTGIKKLTAETIILVSGRRKSGTGVRFTS
jgi:hypothetical protein